jgi:hypothetical protein
MILLVHSQQDGNNAKKNNFKETNESKVACDLHSFDTEGDLKIEMPPLVVD